MERLKAGAAALVLAILLTAGCLFVIAVVAGFFVASFDQANSRNAEYESLVFRPDGTVLIGGYRGFAERTQFKTLTGEVVGAAKIERLAWGIELPANPDHDAENETLVWTRRLSLFDDREPRLAFWYLVHDRRADGHAYFVGYDSLSNDRIGFLGRNGFSNDAPPESEWFPIRDIDPRKESQFVASPVWSSGIFAYPTWGEIGYGSGPFAGNMLLNGQETLYRVDLANRTVSTALTSPATPFRSVARNYSENIDGDFFTAAVRTDDKVFMIPEGRGAPLVFDLPPELRGKYIRWFLTESGEGIAYTVDWLSEECVQHRIYWLDPKGVVKRTADVTLLQRPTTDPGAFALALPSPIVADLVVGVFLPRSQVNRPQPRVYATFDEAAAAVLSAGWPALLALQVLAAALAVVCYRHQVSRGAPISRRIGWATFVFLFGVPGLVGYWTHRKWPVRLACPRCAAVVPRDREVCAGCHEEFPLPERRGIEIFA